MTAGVDGLRPLRGAPSSSQVHRQGRGHVGLDVDPPAHAVMLSIDEKSEIQARDRTQPACSMKEGSRRDHDPR